MKEKEEKKKFFQKYIIYIIYNITYKKKLIYLKRFKIVDDFQFHFHLLNVMHPEINARNLSSQWVVFIEEWLVHVVISRANLMEIKQVPERVMYGRVMGPLAVIVVLFIMKPTTVTRTHTTSGRVQQNAENWIHGGFVIIT